MKIASVKDIVANGYVDGQPVVFRALKERSGMYALGRVIGRKPGTRPNDVCNKILVPTLEKAAEMLVEKRQGKPLYYMFLTYKNSNYNGRKVRRRNQYSIKSIQIIWDE